jgi:hypothetical protein
LFAFVLAYAPSNRSGLDLSRSIHKYLADTPLTGVLVIGRGACVYPTFMAPRSTRPVRDGVCGELRQAAAAQGLPCMYAKTRELSKKHCFTACREGSIPAVRVKDWFLSVDCHVSFFYLHGAARLSKYGKLDLYESR